MRKSLVAGVALWLVATVLVALTPMFFFVAGASDGVSEISRVRFAAIPFLLAWPALTAAIGLVRGWRGATGRAVALLIFAGAVLGLALLFAGTSAIFGDAAWALYWSASVGGWAALSRRAAHPTRDPGLRG